MQKYESIVSQNLEGEGLANENLTVSIVFIIITGAYKKFANFWGKISGLPPSSNFGAQVQNNFLGFGASSLAEKKMRFHFKVFENKESGNGYNQGQSCYSHLFWKQ